MFVWMIMMMFVVYRGLRIHYDLWALQYPVRCLTCEQQSASEDARLLNAGVLPRPLARSRPMIFRQFTPNSSALPKVDPTTITTAMDGASESGESSGTIALASRIRNRSGSALGHQQGPGTSCLRDAAWNHD
jgi:hypothetical protein